MAQELFVTEAAIKQHLQNLYDKFAITTKEERPPVSNPASAECKRLERPLMAAAYVILVINDQGDTHDLEVRWATGRRARVRRGCRVQRVATRRPLQHRAGGTELLPTDADHRHR